MTMPMCLSARIKSLLCKAFLLIEFCHRCGIRQPLIWWCEDNKLWEEVTGSKNGIYCPKCFDCLATKKGIAIRWIAKEDYRFNTK